MTERLGSRMATVPPNAKKPTDRKPKDDGSARFTFEHAGKSYTSKPLMDVLTPAFMRQNRRREELDFQFTMLEELFAGNAKAMEAIDDMTWLETRDLGKGLAGIMKDRVNLDLGE